MAIQSTFRIFDLLVITGAVAVYAGMRAWTIKYADESLVMWSPLIVSLILVIYAAARLCPYVWIYGIALISAFATSTAWAIEKVFQLPGTSFMHDDWVYIHFGTDPIENGVEVVLRSLLVTIACSMVGAMFRYYFEDLWLDQKR